MDVHNSMNYLDFLTVIEVHSMIEFQVILLVTGIRNIWENDFSTHLKIVSVLFPDIFIIAL